MTAVKWSSRKRVATLAFRKRKLRYLGASRERALEASRKNEAKKVVAVRSALQRIQRKLDVFDEEVREEVSMSGIVDAMASMLGESDLTSILTRSSLRAKRRTDFLADVQDQIEQLLKQIDSISQREEVFCNAHHEVPEIVDES